MSADALSYWRDFGGEYGAPDGTPHATTMWGRSIGFHGLKRGNFLIKNTPRKESRDGNFAIYRLLEVQYSTDEVSKGVGEAFFRAQAVDMADMRLVNVILGLVTNESEQHPKVRRDIEACRAYAMSQLETLAPKSDKRV